MEPVKIVTLDNRVRSLCFDELIRPQTVRQVTGEGMPKTSNEQMEADPSLKTKHFSELPRGDLYVRFNV